jgi:hypothetical protein
VHFIRVVVAALPQIKLDVISDVVDGQPDMKVIGAFLTCEALLATRPLPTPDILILGTPSDALGDPCVDVLHALPGARCVAITEDLRETSLYALRPHRQRIGELSLEWLLAVIRGEAHLHESLR